MSRLLRRTGPAAGFASLGLLLVCGACGDDTTPDYTAEELAAAKVQLRDHVRLRTSEAGLLFGREWVRRAPDDAELRALYARQLSAWRLSREIREQAEFVLEEDPDDPWGLYIETLGHFAANDWEPALESSRHAWEASPRPEFAAAHLRALSRHDYDAAFAFLESLDADTRTTPEVLSERAQLESRLQYDRPGPAWGDSSLATYAEMRERWPEYVDGYLHPAEALFGANRSGEALPLIERALALAPGSADVRQWHWTLLSQSDMLPVEERRPAVEASLAAFRDAAPETLRGLSMMASAYRDLEDDERASELDALVIEREPASRHASLVYLREQRAADAELRRVHEAHGEGSPEYRAQLEAVRDAVYRYLERPLYDDTYIGGAYMSLFNALKEMDPVPAEELADAVRGLTAHARGSPPWITYVEAPLALVEHTPHALEAAEIARAGLQASLDYTMSWRDIFDTEGEWEQQVRATLSASYDAMGWAYLSAGRTDDGRHTLERALTLWPENPTALHHMGQLHERLAAEAAERGDSEESTRRLDEAEDAYIVGLGITTFSENPNRAALEELYQERYGTSDGIDDYFATLDERNRIRRRERILASRVEAAGTYESFRLARLDGQVVDSGELGGKIAVLHFWGTWCGPCIVEMPEYQEFHERYREDADVEVISISNDPSNTVVEEYLAKNEFDFTVLVDDGYVSKAGVFAWPTTWFVDREGRVQFVQLGASNRLDEEFMWRVEAIREDAEPATP